MFRQQPTTETNLGLRKNCLESMLIKVAKQSQPLVENQTAATSFNSAALDLPNGRQAFGSLHQGKEHKPAAGDKKK